MVLEAVDHRHPRVVRRRAAASTPAAAWIALTPFHERAEWARSPRVITSKRSVPWQPASTTASEGSIRIAKSGLRPARARSRRSCAARCGLDVDLLALVEDEGQVAVRLGHGGRRAAAPPRPRPSCRRCRARAGSSPSLRTGRLSLSGTVSMCPAITTRSSRPRSVRATRLLPCRVTSRWSSPRSASSIVVGDRPLVAAHRLDVAEHLGQGDGVQREVDHGVKSR